MADQFGGDTGPILPQSERYEQFKKQQASVLQQHQQYSAQLEQKQQQVDARKGDLDIAGRLMKVLDSKLPKSARQFLSKELAQHVGADPKSQQYKDVSTMLMGLDPDSLQGLRSGFAANLDSTAPGEISKTVEGIMTGKIPMDQFIGQVGPMMQTGSGEEATQEGTTQTAGDGAIDPSEGSTAQPMGGAAEIATGGSAPSETTSAAPSASVPQPFQAGEPGNIRSLEGQRTVSPVDAPASPTIVGALGLDSKQIYRNRDLMQGGYTLPYDPKEQDKIATEINTRSTGLSATYSEAMKMADIFEDHPETLGTVGLGVRTLQSTIQQVQGVLHVIGATDETNAYLPETQKLARSVGTKLAKIHNIEVTAGNAAQLDSMALSLAYKMAIANDIPGNRLTNVILDQNLRQIGQSSSPQQFKAVLSSTLQATTREFNESIQRSVGANGTDILVRKMSQADLDAMATRAERDSKTNDGNDLLPEDFRRSLLNEAIRRQQGGGASPITPSSPTIDEEQQTLGGLETQSKTRSLASKDQDMQIAREREERAKGAETRADTREERLTSAQEKAQKLEQEKFAYSQAEHEKDNLRAEEANRFSREEHARDNAFAREQFDYRKSQDQKAEDKARGDKIAAAFQHFGAAIAGSVRGGGGGGGVPSLGGGQDVSAFRMTPPPQRTPPRVGR